jgi:cytoskeleton protein RodZ
MSEEILVPQPADCEVSVATESYGPSEACLDADVLNALSVGQQLRAAREAKGVSAADVAKALKLSLHQVVALEEDDWSRLPGNTIIRGFVRNYARLVKLDADPLMQALTDLQMPQPPKLDLPAGTSTSLPQAGKVERRDFATVFSGLALVVLAVLAYFFMPQDFWQSKLVEFMAGISGPATVVEKKDMPRSDMVSVPLAPSSGVATVVAEPATMPVPPVAAQGKPDVLPAPTSESSSGLKLSFAQPSWVEIRDRSGQIIFSQLNPAGSQRDIEGQPPFALVVGNATNVTVQYKGKVIELSQRSKDDVARLNLE